MHQETNLLDAFQVTPGRPCAFVGEGDSGESYAARELARERAAAGIRVKYIAAGAADSLGALKAHGVAVDTLPFASLGSADASAASKLLEGADLVLIDGFRIAVGTHEPSACLRALMLLERVSRERAASVVVILGSHAPELLDGLGSVVVVRRAQRKGDARVHVVEQLQQPRDAFERAKPTHLVLEQSAGAVLGRFDRDGFTLQEREQRISDAELVMECILDRPGSHIPAAGSIDSARASAAVADLVEAGRVIVKGSRLSPDLYPAPTEVEKRAAIDFRVLEVIAKYDDIAEASLPKRAQLEPEQARGAVARLRHAKKVRVQRNEAGEPCFILEAVGQHRDAVQRVRDAIAAHTVDAHNLVADAELASAEQADKIIAELLADGVIEPFEDGRYCIVGTAKRWRRTLPNWMYDEGIVDEDGNPVEPAKRKG